MIEFVDEVHVYEDINSASLRKVRGMKILRKFLVPKDSEDEEDEASDTEDDTTNVDSPEHKSMNEPASSVGHGRVDSHDESEQLNHEDFRSTHHLEEQLRKITSAADITDRGLVYIGKPLVKALFSELGKDEPTADAFQFIKEQVYFSLLREYRSFIDGSGEFLRYAQFREYVNSYEPAPEDFKTFRVIGKGAFGEVSAVSKEDTRSVYAVKEMSKRMMKAEDHLHMCSNERDILCSLDSDFCTTLHYVLQTDKTLMFVMDFCSGGDLKWHLHNDGVRDEFSQYQHYPLERARFYAAETLVALEHIHSRGIVYRDLKPHNLLLDANGHVVVSDFGLAEKLALHSNNAVSSLSGTPAYWAPEVLMRVKYRGECDIWSFGVTLYFFLTGMKPRCSCKEGQWCTFLHGDEKTQERLAKDAGMAAYNPEIRFPDGIDPMALDLMQKCLVADRDERITLEGIKAHQFFESIEWEKLALREVDPPFIPDRQDINAASLAEVGEINTQRYRRVKLDLEEVDMFDKLNYCNEALLQQEIADALKKEYNRFGSKPEEKYREEMKHEKKGGCCTIL